MFGREKEMDLGLSASSGRPDPVPGSSDPGPSGSYQPGRFALALFTLAVFAAGAFMFVTVEGNALDDPVKQAERGEISTNDTRSLVREANLTRALRTLAGEIDEGGYIDSFRLAPTRINAIVVQPSGRRENLTINVAFEVTAVDSGTGEGEGLMPSDIDPAAPERIIRVANRKFELRPQNFDYMVANEGFSEGEDSSWTAFWKLPLKDNDISAAADGTDVRPLGTPDAKTRAETKATQQAVADAQRAAAERAQCISRAETAEQIQRCVR